MKKIYTYLMMVMMTLTTMTTMTSCDRDTIDREDRAEARTLDGTWTGYIDTYYYDRWHKGGDTFRTSIYFERENPYGGWGYEIDYNVNSRYVDYYCEFRWEVSNGRIRIKYDDSWGDVIIYDYTLTDSYFDGYMDDGTNKEIHFRLNYDSRFDWDSWRRTWRTRSPTAKDSTETKSEK